MSKSKQFKRKLARPRVGLRYYRIWGWPLRYENMAHHQALYKSDPSRAVITHPDFGWLHLMVEECTVFPYPRHRPGSWVLSGSVSDRYFKKESQALRVLSEYRDLIRHDGLADMVGYHEDLDQWDRVH